MKRRENRLTIGFQITVRSARFAALAPKTPGKTCRVGNIVRLTSDEESQSETDLLSER
jgi:hypothetical protein